MRAPFDTKRRFRLLVSLLISGGLALAAAGCVKPPGQVVPDGATSSDAGVDSATLDAAPDASTALRRLVSRRLFGQMPVDNRFVDPTFTQVGYTGWVPLDYDTYEYATTFAYHHRTPTDAPGLVLRRQPGASYGTLMGTAKSASGPVQVSLWVGVPRGSDSTAPQVRLLGIWPDGGSSVDLEADEDTATQTLGDVVWTFWKADLDEGAIGWVTLRIKHRDTPPLYLNGPQLIRATASVKSRRRWRPAPRTPLTREEWVNLSAYFRTWQDRL